MSILRVVNVSKRFGGLQALKDVSLNIDEGEIVGLIGPNGSGKTTLFNVIAGFYKPESGKVFFLKEDITKLKANKICRMGIARTFQLPKPFPNLSVLDNVVSGSLFGAGLKFTEARAHAEKCLKLLGIDEFSNEPVKNLTGQTVKLVEIARALATKPRLLLLDEIMAGLTTEEIRFLLGILKDEVNKKLGITILWIEHVLSAIIKNVDRIVVLNYGQKIAEGKPSEVANDRRVVEAYIGESMKE